MLNGHSPSLGWPNKWQGFIHTLNAERTHSIAFCSASSHGTRVVRQFRNHYRSRPKEQRIGGLPRRKSAQISNWRNRNFSQRRVLAAVNRHFNSRNRHRDLSIGRRLQKSRLESSLLKLLLESRKRHLRDWKIRCFSHQLKVCLWNNCEVFFWIGHGVKLCVVSR